MANNYKGNPIVIDSVGSDLDLANLIYGNSNVGVFINGIRLVNPTLNDKIVLKDGSGNIVATLTADATGKDISSLEENHKFHVNSGLKMLTADQTLTTGKVLIYTR